MICRLSACCSYLETRRFIRAPFDLAGSLSVMLGARRRLLVQACNRLVRRDYSVLILPGAWGSLLNRVLGLAVLIIGLVCSSNCGCVCPLLLDAAINLALCIGVLASVTMCLLLSFSVNPRCGFAGFLLVSCDSGVADVSRRLRC